MNPLLSPLIGEYACKLDDKGRFLLPSGLRKQLPARADTGVQDSPQGADFVVNRGLDACLVLYPMPVWESEMARIQSLNQYAAENRAFVRMFLNGATPITLDGSDRMNLPKALCDYAAISREIVLIAQIDRIEIWDKDRYAQWLSNPGFDFATLAEKVMQALPHPSSPSQP